MLIQKESVMIPGFVLSLSDLSPGAKLLYSALCHVSAKTGQDQCSLGQRSMAQWIGQSIRSVQNHLDGLAKAELIQIIPATSTGTASTYRILIKPADPRQRKKSYRKKAQGVARRHQRLPRA